MRADPKGVDGVLRHRQAIEVGVRRRRDVAVDEEPPGGRSTICSRHPASAQPIHNSGNLLGDETGKDSRVNLGALGRPPLVSSSWRVSPTGSGSGLGYTSTSLGDRRI